MTSIVVAITNPKTFRNRGLWWIQHGDNVITLKYAQSNGNYFSIVTVQLASMGGVTTRGPYHNTNPMTVTTKPDPNDTTNTRLLVRLHGGFGFVSGGDNTTVGTGFVTNVDRFDDIANTQTARTGLPVATNQMAGFSLNGFGFTANGGISPPDTTTKAMNRFDDVINTHTARANATNFNRLLTGYSINGFGFVSCGLNANVTERFDDVINTWTTRTAATARYVLAGYGLNGFGFTSCGFIAAVTGTTERFDDIVNSQTARTAATARDEVAGYSLNGFGFTSCGTTTNAVAGAVGTTERFDDIANSQTARTAATVRIGISGYSLNGFGFTSGGIIPAGPAVTGVTQRFDDIANTQTVMTALPTARTRTAAYSTNEYFVNYKTVDV